MYITPIIFVIKALLWTLAEHSEITDIESSNTYRFYLTVDKANNSLDVIYIQRRDNVHWFDNLNDWPSVFFSTIS